MIAAGVQPGISTDQKQRGAGTRAGLITGPAVAVIMLASGPLPLPGLG